MKKVLAVETEVIYDGGNGLMTETFVHHPNDLKEAVGIDGYLMFDTEKGSTKIFMNRIFRVHSQPVQWEEVENNLKGVPHG